MIKSTKVLSLVNKAFKFSVGGGVAVFDCDWSF